MLHELDFLRGMGLSGVVFRVALALLCGGVIGIERAEKRRPAGFRTYMMVSMGAALAMVLSYHTYTSVWLAILHGILGWVYVVYHMLRF